METSHVDARRPSTIHHARVRDDERARRSPANARPARAHRVVRRRAPRARRRRARVNLSRRRTRRRARERERARDDLRATTRDDARVARARDGGGGERDDDERGARGVGRRRLELAGLGVERTRGEVRENAERFGVRGRQRGHR